jgi:ABC-type antimicrobial peptide transport system permease subunit
VVRLFARQGARFIAIGLGAGMVLALGLSALVRSFVWGVSAFDPVSYLVAAVVFGGVALLACWLPARRAARVEPLEALRTL